uniref:hypothetical protein n=1 Tax=Pectobacterium cacticida TaxID=69221 RepID=UPI00366F848F
MFAETYNGLLLHVHKRMTGLMVCITVYNKMIRQTEAFFAGTIEGAISGIRNVLDYFLIAATIPFLVFYMVKDIELMKKDSMVLDSEVVEKAGQRLFAGCG